MACPNRSVILSAVSLCLHCGRLVKGGYVGQYGHMIEHHSEIIQNAPYAATCRCGFHTTSRDDMFAHLDIKFPFTLKKVSGVWMRA